MENRDSLVFFSLCCLPLLCLVHLSYICQEISCLGVMINPVFFAFSSLVRSGDSLFDNLHFWSKTILEYFLNADIQLEGDCYSWVHIHFLHVPMFAYTRPCHMTRVC